MTAPADAVRRPAGDRHGVVTRAADPDAPAVVCEGGLAAPVELWAALARAVAAGGATVAVSERAGVARSPRPRSPRTLGNLAAELSAFVASRVGGPAVLVGEGFGGLVLVELARRRPDQVAGLVLVDCPHPKALARSARQRQAMARLETVLLREAVSAALRRPVRDHGFDRLDPDSARSALAALRAAPWTARTALAELRAWKRAAPVPGPLAPLPAGPPLAVVSSTDLLRGDPSYARLQPELLGLSPGARAHPVPGSRPLLDPQALAVLSTVVRDLAHATAPQRPPAALTAGTGHG